MALAREKEYTIEDIYNLPEGQRAELLDGQMYMMAPPSTAHQRIANYISTEINLYIRSNSGKCEVFSAPFAVFLNKDAYTYVEPDISVICDPGKLNEKGCQGAPDWVIEIVSPGSQRMDYMIKLAKYQTSGVREYWIVDQQKDRIMVYDFERGEMNEYTFSESVKVGIYEDFEIDFSKVL